MLNINYNKLIIVNWWVVLPKVVFLNIINITSIVVYVWTGKKIYITGMYLIWAMCILGINPSDTVYSLGRAEQWNGWIIIDSSMLCFTFYSIISTSLYLSHSNISTSQPFTFLYRVCSWHLCATDWYITLNESVLLKIHHKNVYNMHQHFLFHKTN